MILLLPLSQVTIERFQMLTGGATTTEGSLGADQGLIRERHAKINLDSGNISFNVAQAESPPNSWVFGTQEGLVTIQGTQGNLKRRVSATASEDGSKANVGIDFKVEQRYFHGAVSEIPGHVVDQRVFRGSGETVYCWTSCTEDRLDCVGSESKELFEGDESTVFIRCDDIWSATIWI